MKKLSIDYCDFSILMISIKQENKHKNIKIYYLLIILFIIRSCVIVLLLNTYITTKPSIYCIQKLQLQFDYPILVKTIFLNKTCSKRQSNVQD